MTPHATAARTGAPCVLCGRPYAEHSDSETHPEPGAPGWGELCPGQPWPGQDGWRDNQGHDRYTPPRAP